jgi:hypothetical protein
MHKIAMGGRADDRLSTFMSVGNIVDTCEAYHAATMIPKSQSHFLTFFETKRYANVSIQRWPQFERVGPSSESKPP